MQEINRITGFKPQHALLFGLSLLPGPTHPPCSRAIKYPIEAFPLLSRSVRVTWQSRSSEKYWLERPKDFRRVADKRRAGGSPLRMALKKQPTMPGTRHRQNNRSKASRNANAGPSLPQAGHLMAMVLVLPEIRENKILQIQQMIRSGTYSIDSRKIAAAMLCEQ